MFKEDVGVMVYCRNACSLIGYSTRLNALGHYRLSLCSSATEVTELLEAGKRFRFLVFDGFDLGSYAQLLNELAWFEAINEFVVVADVNSMQRLEIFYWAKDIELPLRAVLQAPLRDYELALALGCGDASGGPTALYPGSFLVLDGAC
ncbi:hypothetical protein ACA097_19610 [Pseudomonas sp. QL9]|uniref:hypothetical protein n=1 Tax=Pseudomonas sp. QL9 TaxID=3242725 RepID=UPI00352BBC68